MRRALDTLAAIPLFGFAVALWSVVLVGPLAASVVIGLHGFWWAVPIALAFPYAPLSVYVYSHRRRHGTWAGIFD